MSDPTDTVPNPDPDPVHRYDRLGLPVTYSPWLIHISSPSTCPVAHSINLVTLLSHCNSPFLRYRLFLPPHSLSFSPLYLPPILPPSPSIDLITLEAHSLIAVLTPSWELLVRTVTYLARTFYIPLTRRTLPSPPPVTITSSSAQP
jgi:hypothetical protein